MQTYNGRYILMTEDEYIALYEQAKARRDSLLTNEEREIMAEAIQLLQIHDMMEQYERCGGRINGRTIADRAKVIRRLMMKFDR